jgi:putative PIN family toxin of toxin-antitoxin system
MRVVLDSNILFSALISPHGPPHRIYEAWRQRRFELVTTGVQLDELLRASRYPKFRGILQPHRVGRMLNNLQGATILGRLPGGYAAVDPNDAWLLALADTARADYLVTGDKRLIRAAGPASYRDRPRPYPGCVLRGHRMTRNARADRAPATASPPEKNPTPRVNLYFSCLGMC